MWFFDHMITWLVERVIIWSHDLLITWLCYSYKFINCLNLKHHSECFKLAKLVSIFHIFCIQSLLRCWNLCLIVILLKTAFPQNCCENIRFLCVFIWHGGHFITSSAYSLRIGLWDNNSKDFFLRIKGISVYLSRHFLQVSVSKNFHLNIQFSNFE